MIVRWSFLLCCISASLMTSGQSQLSLHSSNLSRTDLHDRDSTGHVPALRVDIAPHSEEPLWRQRVMRQHLLDFSDDDPKSNAIVVDPVVEAFVGQLMPASDGDPIARSSIWDNIRGARFRAIIDERWHLGGELLERQGIAEPLLGYWAEQNRIPGWGRSKLGKDNGHNTIEDAYFDVAQTRGWMGWISGAWEWDVGIDALHIGAGRSSAFLSQQAVPSPYARASFVGKNHRTTGWTTRWMSTRRGPLGETAESLLERTRAVFLTHQQFIGKHWVVQGVYQFSWETTPLEVPEGWEALGMLPGETYQPHRHTTGMEVQFHHSLTQRANWIAYAQQSFDVGTKERFIPGRESQVFIPLTTVLGTRLNWRSISLQSEFVNRSDAHCRDCWGYLGISNAGPLQSVHENAGISTQSLWNNSFRLNGQASLHRWQFSALKEWNNIGEIATAQVEFLVQPVWPLSIALGWGRVNSSNPILNYQQLTLGVRAGILSWK